jgi:hypothetical protein
MSLIFYFKLPWVLSSYCWNYISLTLYFLWTILKGVGEALMLLYDNHLVELKNEGEIE